MFTVDTDCLSSIYLSVMQDEETLIGVAQMCSVSTANVQTSIAVRSFRTSHSYRVKSYSSSKMFVKGV